MGDDYSSAFAAQREEYYRQQDLATARAEGRKAGLLEAAEMAANMGAVGTEARFKLGNLSVRLRAKAEES